jgi:hypothetical protein
MKTILTVSSALPFTLGIHNSIAVLAQSDILVLPT